MSKCAKFVVLKYTANDRNAYTAGCSRYAAGASNPPSVLTSTADQVQIHWSGSATAPPLLPECRENRISGMWALRPAASSRAQMAASTGIPSSTRSLWHPSDRSPWRQAIRTSWGREPANRSSAATSRGTRNLQSLDAGKTWSLMGLEKVGPYRPGGDRPAQSRRRAGVRARPRLRAQQERGVFRTSDGGKTWDKVLFVDENTGCSDLGMDPNNSRILFAGMWQIEIHTWGAHQRRTGQRFVQVDGRGRHLEAPGGSWPAALPCWPDCRARGPERFEPRVRGD